MPTTPNNALTRQADPLAERTNLFTQIINDLSEHGYSVQQNALPAPLSGALQQLCMQQSARFSEAGLGRGGDFRRQQSIRRDKVQWIHGDHPAEQAWLESCDALRQQINQQLFLGLESFESHFSHYAPGDFYRRHLDAFRRQPGAQVGNPSAEKPSRKLSITAYFNDNWQMKDGGQLALYSPENLVEADNRQPVATVTPENGTLCLFLSEDFPHEVLPTYRDRYAIAGWFRSR